MSKSEKEIIEEMIVGTENELIRNRLRLRYIEKKNLPGWAEDDFTQTLSGQVKEAKEFLKFLNECYNKGGIN